MKWMPLPHRGAGRTAGRSRRTARSIRARGTGCRAGSGRRRRGCRVLQHPADDLRHREVLEDALVAALGEVGQLRDEGEAIAGQALARVALSGAADQAVDTVAGGPRVRKAGLCSRLRGPAGRSPTSSRSKANGWLMASRPLKASTCRSRPRPSMARLKWVWLAARTSVVPHWRRRPIRLSCLARARQGRAGSIGSCLQQGGIDPARAFLATALWVIEGTTASEAGRVRRSRLSRRPGSASRRSRRCRRLRGSR